MSVHLILVLVQLCFATMAIAGKLALRHVPPAALVLARVAGGTLVFLLAARRLRADPPLRRPEILRLIVALHLGVFVNQTFFVAGLARSTAINATVINTTIPVIASALALLSRAEQASARRITGIVVALTGALLMAHADHFSFHDEHVAGNLMLLVNASAYGIFLVVVRPLSRRLAPTALAALLFTGALPAAAIAGVPAWIELAPRLTGRDAALIAFIIAVPTVLAYGLNQLAIARAPTSLVAIYIYLQPILSVVGAAALLGERPDARTFSAAVLIFTGVWLCARSPRAPSAVPPDR